MNQLKNRIALEADTIAAKVEDDAGNKLIDMKGPLSEYFFHGLHNVNKKKGSIGEYALESQAIDTVLLRKHQNNNSGEKVEQVQDISQSVAQTQYTIYGVNPKMMRPEDIVEVKTLVEKMDAPEKDKFLVVVDACQPSFNSPVASAPTTYVEHLNAALEAFCDTNGIRMYGKLSAALESIL